MFQELGAPWRTCIEYLSHDNAALTICIATTANRRQLIPRIASWLEMALHEVDAGLYSFHPVIDTTVQQVGSLMERHYSQMAGIEAGKLVNNDSMVSFSVDLDEIS